MTLSKTTSIRLPIILGDKGGVGKSLLGTIVADMIRAETCPHWRSGRVTSGRLIEHEPPHKHCRRHRA